jgi:hypothetical protein
MPYIGSVPAQTALTSANIADGAVNSDQIATGAVDLAHMSSQSVDEDNLHISNAGSNGQFLSKQSGDAGGLTWAAAAQFANWTQSSGHLTPDNASYGIHLGVSTATAANLLDDYEEGTFTGVFRVGGTSGTDNGSGTCQYVKVGSLVHVCGAFGLDSTVSGSGNLHITGLPFTCTDITSVASWQVNDKMNTTLIALAVTADASTMIFITQPGDTSSGAANATNGIMGNSGGKVIYFNASYHVDF